MSLPVITMPLAAAALLLAAVGCTRPPSAESAGEVRRVWDAYLASKRGLYAQEAGTPSPLWSAAEQAQWPMYDLAGFYLPDHASPEVVSVTPVDATTDSAYAIVTRFRSSTDAGAGRPLAEPPTITVHARREGRRWVLANTLPYRTHTWTRVTRGRLTFRVAPGLRHDPAKAAQSAAFVDSLAAAFGVVAPPHLDYYVAESVDQALEILGVATGERYGAAGGFAKPVNRQVFSGIPALGEAYRHELVHVVLLPLVRETGTTLLASEGIASWYGGTGGRDYPESVRHLDEQLRARPSLTLDVIVDDLRVASDIRNAAGAVLADLVHDAGGVAALRPFLQAPSRDLRATLSRLLGRPWPAIGLAWRARISSVAARPAS